MSDLKSSSAAWGISIATASLPLPQMGQGGKPRRRCLQGKAVSSSAVQPFLAALNLAQASCLCLARLLTSKAFSTSRSVHAFLSC